MSQTLRVIVVIALYLLLNSSLNMLNKWALASFFPFPLLLTTVHMMFSFVVRATLFLRHCPASALSCAGQHAQRSWAKPTVKRCNLPELLRQMFMLCPYTIFKASTPCSPLSTRP